MARIKVKDLPQDSEIDRKTASRLRGGTDPISQVSRLSGPVSAETLSYSPPGSLTIYEDTDTFSGDGTTTVSPVQTKPGTNLTLPTK